MIELYILGPAEIRNERGELAYSFLSGPKRLALLTYLLLYRPRGYQRRDSLLPMFWPDHDQKSARNALSNMLFHIRKTLGEAAIRNRGHEEIKLDTSAFWSDAIQFEKALDKKNYEQAIQLYRGELLKGFHVPDVSPAFDQWLTRERNRYQSMALQRTLKLAEDAVTAGLNKKAQQLADKAIEIDPKNEEVRINQIYILGQIGDRAGATKALNAYSSWSFEEFGEYPSSDITQFVEGLKTDTLPAQKVNSFPEKSVPSSLSIAVLPFELIGGESSLSFAYAIHGDILTRLSNIGELIVTSRTSVMAYQNHTKQLAEIARELNVKWLITGEVQEFHGQVQVNIRLTDGTKDQQVWGDVYHKSLNANNLFTIQAEITRQVTSELKLQLTPNQQDAIDKLPTSSLEAFRLQALGRRSMDQRTEEGLRNAETYFRQAISYDNNYALAWVGLSDCLCVMADYVAPMNESWLQEAEKAAKHALELNGNLAEAYASLALVYGGRKEGAKAMELLNKAIAMRYHYADAHNWLSWGNNLLGYREQALSSALKAVELNPTHQESIANLSLSWLVTGEYEKAKKEAKRLQEIQPDLPDGYFLQALAYYHTNNFKKSISLLKDLSVYWAGSGVKLLRALSYLALNEMAAFLELQNEFIYLKDQFSIALLEMATGEQKKGIARMRRKNEWDSWESLVVFSLFPDILGSVRTTEAYQLILDQVRAYNGG